MKSRDIFSYSFGAIKLRKLRAGLTTLGVVIGIAAIVALLSLGQGFENTITEQFQKGFATDTLIVSPRSFGLGESGFQLYVSDAETIQAIQNVTEAVPVIQRACYINSSRGSFLVNIAGVDFQKYAAIYSSTFVAASGSISATPSNDSIVIGARVSDPWQNGTKILNVNDAVEVVWRKGTHENVTYTGHVSAVLGEIGGFGFGGPSDYGVYIPIGQAESFFGTNQTGAIIVQVNSSDDATINSVSEAIRNAFSNEVSVVSSTALLSTISSVFSTVELFLAGIAGISLLVAGIGIMNIMIVSLMERTREIGILKALGMRNRTVLLIFLSEAAIIGFLGAAIGIALGMSLAYGFARFGVAGMGGGFGGGGGRGGGEVGNVVTFKIAPVLTPTVFVGAFAFGLLVSVVFAVYPAWRASRLKPVEALRYE